jgi:hypothetical protein
MNSTLEILRAEGIADWMVEIVPATTRDYRKRPESLPLAYPVSVQAVHTIDRRGRGCVGRLRRGKRW